MASTPNLFLSRMLDRLYAQLISGPSLNCKPHNSRQRIDVTRLAVLQDLPPDELLRRLLAGQTARFQGRVPAVTLPGPSRARGGYAEDLAPEDSALRKAWQEQNRELARLQAIAEDARTYEQETGVSVLSVGFPLLSMPRAGAAPDGTGSRRILAPLAFIPVQISITWRTTPVVEFSCRGQGVDFVTPNLGLLAWVERQTGKPLRDLFEDEEGEDPWRELNEIVSYVCEALEVPAAALLGPESQLEPCPTAELLGDDPKILCSAVAGLFPLSNQSLIHDMQAMVAGESLEGTVRNFLASSLTLQRSSQASEAAPPERPRMARQFAQERFLLPADPCQVRAARMARFSEGLVVHGPPGTGKSQTITNIITDHLARGRKVLLVSDKRTALDVVHNRLRHLGLGELCAVIHDARLDQRDLYKAIRAQLEALSEAPTDPAAEPKLERVDAELERLHAELSAYASALHDGLGHDTPSLHALIGAWSGLETALDISLGGPTDAGPDLLTARQFEDHVRHVREMLERGLSADYAHNPWVAASGLTLGGLLGLAPDAPAKALRPCLEAAIEVDAHPLGPVEPRRATQAGAALSPGPVEPQRATQAGAARSPGPSASGETMTETSPTSARLVLPEDAGLEALAPACARLADRLTAIADVDPAAARAWSTRDFTALKGIRTRRLELQHDLDVMRQGPLEPELERFTIRPAMPPQKVQAGLEPLRAWLELAGPLTLRFATAMRARPDLGAALIARWTVRPVEELEAALRGLEGVSGALERLRNATPDPQLAALDAGKPQMAAQLDWTLEALTGYLDAAGKWYGFLSLGAKNRAKTALEPYALPLTEPNAVRVKAWTQSQKDRLSLTQALRQLEAPEAEQTAGDAGLIGAVMGLRGALELLRGLPEPGRGAAGGSGIGGADARALDQALSLRFKVQAARASEVLGGFGLELELVAVERLARFLTGLPARMMLRRFHDEQLDPDGPVKTDDASLERAIDDHDRLASFMSGVERDPAETSLLPAVRPALAELSRAPDLADALRRAGRRAAALGKLERAMAGAGLFDLAWQRAVVRAGRGLETAWPGPLDGELLGELFRRLEASLPTLERIVRIGAAFEILPLELEGPVRTMLGEAVDPEAGLEALRKALLAAEIRQRIQGSSLLHAMDGQRVQSLMERVRVLEVEKRELVQASILSQWRSRQKPRLLAMTGARLNGLGADLARRLLLRGKRAMKLRKVIELGRLIEDGDPLFDLCPVWMASPNTVAQLFPREPWFDVVIFDEASQLRLEEALPVLTRAERFVIAGDPQQLPPTRFFESAVVQSEDNEAENEQELFEQQQSEVEDLLSAALNLELDQCYLDVHYRSRSSALIQFSNRHFYRSRLQAVPARPTIRRGPPAISLYPVGGIYQERSNLKEAEQVCALVRELLGQPEPPSIGIACFNVNQRDLVVQVLEQAAVADAEFARQLGAARTRSGEGSFEGLFVRNLENVQGDERDHMIISTTYGPQPDPKDPAKLKFYRRFGPLGLAGGGRRLNVLVTRARSRIHLVTSIPAELYRSLPALEAGREPNGGWLLLAYLAYAEEVAGRAAETGVGSGERGETAASGEGAAVGERAAGAAGRESADLKQGAGPVPVGGAVNPTVRVHPVAQPSHFAVALARKLARDHGIGSDVHWGNDGFCVDLAPEIGEGAEAARAVGVLSDFARFDKADDRVEWDLFRTAMLEQQGWRFQRVWTPRYFRSGEESVRAIVRAAEAARGG